MEEENIDRDLADIGRLIRLIQKLRGGDGCPWDRKQTPESMLVYLTEEIYELVEAVESGNSGHICEELGDIWFHLLFIANIYKERDGFTIGDVARRNTEKMIRRHPHVFADSAVDDAEAVRVQWQKIKAGEKKQAKTGSVLDSVPSKTPALLRAYRVSERAAGAGFDWEDVWGVIEKVEEELSELKTALAEESREKVALEFGDVLFTLANVARHARIHPEPALTKSINKFERRFRHMEQTMNKDGKMLESVSRNEKERYWETAKEEHES
jgi:tetrapyrrole methylase family protein / MazG family protein